MSRAPATPIRSSRRSLAHAQPATERVSFLAPVVGLLVAIDEASRPLVDFPGNRADAPIPARCTVSIAGHAGADAVLVFDGGDPACPIIVGLMREGSPLPTSAPPDTTLNGERIDLAAADQLTLRCGRASITLTRAGKVLIRGAYISSRSSGTNRIKGGSVQIN